MEFKEGDFSRVVREADAARKARLIAIGQQVWAETNYRGAGKIVDKTALALGRDLEKAARWLAIGAQVPAYRNDLGTLRNGVASALAVVKGDAGRVIAQRLEPVLMASEKALDWQSVCDMLAALESAADEALGRTSAGELIQVIFGSTAKLWVRRVAAIYERFLMTSRRLGMVPRRGRFIDFALRPIAPASATVCRRRMFERR